MIQLDIQNINSITIEYRIMIYTRAISVAVLSHQSFASQCLKSINNSPISELNAQNHRVQMSLHNEASKK